MEQLLDFDTFAVEGPHYRISAGGYWAVGSGMSQAVMLDLSFFPLSEEAESVYVDHSKLLDSFSSSLNKAKFQTVDKWAAFLRNAIIIPLPKAKIPGRFEKSMDRPTCLLVATRTYLEFPDDLAHKIVRALFQEAMSELDPSFLHSLV